MQSINIVPGVPNNARSKVESFGEVDPYFPERNLWITGITKDAMGEALGSCTVKLFDKNTDIESNSTISDAAGNFTLSIPKGLSQTQETTWQLMAYKAGIPDVVGITVNTLVGT